MITYLALLQFKHWYIDFVLQTDAMVKGKGIYGNLMGMLHSGQHAFATFLITVLITNWYFALFIAALDFATHYHIDWVKMNYGNRDITNPLFWNHLGLDQMAHQIVYLILAAILFL
jgi:Protein of unknown function (DUF3307)